jgi:hypothetical protein
MNVKLRINGALVYAAFLAYLFSLVYQFGGLQRLIIVMNAFCFGVFVSLTVLYIKYLYYLIKHDSTWNHYKHFAVATSLAWCAIFAMIAASVQRHSGTNYNISSTLFLDIAGRYLAIIGGTMQIFAPGQGTDSFYGVDRRTLIISSAIGLGVAFFIIAMQSLNLLD